MLGRVEDNFCLKIDYEKLVRLLALVCLEL